MRCFLAIDLPSEVKEGISRIQKSLPEASMKLVEKENLHLTLIFLDELTDYEINRVKEELKKLNLQKFEAHLGSIGIFPSESFIRVVWVSMEPSLLVKEIHDKIFESIKDVKKFDKRFESHITLSRVKYIQDKETFISKLKKIKTPQVKFNVDSIALKKSTLTKQGPIYENVFIINLS